GLSTTTEGDAAEGAVKGAGIGAAAGALAALACMIVPGIGLVVGAGPLALAILATAASTAAGAMAGGVYGYLKDQGVPEAVATDYQEAVRRGGAIIAVPVPTGELDRPAVEQLLTKYQPIHISAFAPPVVR